MCGRATYRLAASYADDDVSKDQTQSGSPSARSCIPCRKGICIGCCTCAVLYGILHLQYWYTMPVPRSTHRPFRQRPASQRGIHMGSHLISQSPTTVCAPHCEPLGLKHAACAKAQTRGQAV